VADDIRFTKHCSRLPVVPNARPIVAIVDDDNAVGNAIEVLMRSVGLIAKAFSSGEEFLRSPELSHTSCLVVDFDNNSVEGY